MEQLWNKAWVEWSTGGMEHQRNGALINYWHEVKKFWTETGQFGSKKLL